MLNLIIDIASKHNLRKSGGRFTGPCKKCGGSSRSEKFSMYTDGGFRCFGCGWKGDLITWLREIDGKTCPEAHEAAGVPCRFDGCQVKGTCRLGDGSGKRIARQPRVIEPHAGKQDKDLPLTVVKSPAVLWREWAELLTEKAMPRLQANNEALSWLAKRGISSETADRFGLGWLDHDHKVKRDTIGLQPRAGKTDLWIPGGLLISIYDDNRIHRLRVRRTDEARANFLPDLKYVWLEGSGNEPLILRPSGAPRGAVIVEAELDAIATAAAHDQVLVIALGTVSSGLPAAVRAELLALPVILLALDADQGKDGKQGAGPAAIDRWQKAFRQARFWPVPQGKDPGHFAELGGSLRAWVEAGLLPQVSRPASTQVHDLPLSPVSFTSGDGGKDISTGKQENAASAGATAAELQPAYDTVPLPEVIPALRWCCVCFGDTFLAGVNGGYFCIACQPVGVLGRIVKAGRARQAYVVD